MTEDELHALELLTPQVAEPYEAHVLRIAHAPGEEGRIARAVKLADLDDDLAHPAMPIRTPPYTWARRHIAVARWRSDEPGHADQMAG